MRVSRRQLDVGSDGKAPVLLLTDPIPRHLSIVNWGANDTPAASWKSAEGQVMAYHTLRSPPGATVTNASTVNAQVLTEFLNETMSAWVAAMAGCFAKPLESADRGAQMRALTVQAGARISAAATALGKSAQTAASSHKVADLELPELPTDSTLQGEIDRRSCVKYLEEASAALIDTSMRLMAEGGSVTENILAAFGDVANAFSQWAGSLPRGVVGVSSQPSATERASASYKIRTNRNAGKIDIETREKVGDGWSAWFSAKVDAAALEVDLIDSGSVVKTSPQFKLIKASIPGYGVKFETRPSPSESARQAKAKADSWGKDAVRKRNSANKSKRSLPTEIHPMSFSIEDLENIVQSNPKRFLEAFKTAMTNAQAADSSFKFVWGQTGDDPFDADAIMAQLTASGGEGLQSLIMGSVGGINLDAVGPDNTQVASAFKSVLATAIVAEMKTNTTLRDAVVDAIAAPVGEAIASTVKSALDNGGSPTETFNFSDDDDDDDLTADLPGRNRR